MKSEFLKNKKIISLLSLITVVAVVAAVFIIPTFTGDIKSYIYGRADSTVLFEEENYDTVFDDGAQFMFDSTNSAVAIRSLDGSALFNFASASASENALSTVLEVRLRDKKGNAYSMNSSSNSVDMNTFELLDKTDNSLSIKYNLIPSHDGEERNALYTNLVVDFKVEDSRLNVSVDLSKAELPEGFVIEKISVLPGLFSVSSGEDAIYTVPDGCGAQIDMSAVTQNPISLNLSVYGSDISFYEYSKGALLPFFAAQKNGLLVNAIIEDGDALSEITFKKHENGGGYLYNTFTVTACGYVDGKFKMGVPYNGVISQAYAVSSRSTDYNTIAHQVSDSLQEMGYLNGTSTFSAENYPFFVNVVGSADGKNTLTSFEDAAEITALLQAKGVKNIALRFSGYAKNGIKTDAEHSNSFSSHLGGEEGFGDLRAQIVAQSNSLYLDANILQDKKNDKSSYSLYSDISRVLSLPFENVSLAPRKKVSKNIDELYTFLTEYQVSGVALNDASFILGTDLKGKINRQDILNNTVYAAQTLETVGSLMLSEPAVYLMKQADTVFSTPHSASCTGMSAVTTVPVLQMVLHGSIVYGSTPVNVSDMSFEDAFLKSVEYGCVPSFLFTHDSNTNISYSSYASEIARLYSRAKQLQPVINMRMTSHEKITDGVFKITYDYSSVVYVNYNPSAVEINGVMISPKDFIVI